MKTATMTRTSLVFALLCGGACDRAETIAGPGSEPVTSDARSERTFVAGKVLGPVSSNLNDGYEPIAYTEVELHRVVMVPRMVPDSTGQLVNRPYFRFDLLSATTADASGRFRFEDLAVGAYAVTLKPTAPGFNTAFYRIPQDRLGTEIEMPVNRMNPALPR